MRNIDKLSTICHPSSGCEAEPPFLSFGMFIHGKPQSQKASEKNSEVLLDSKEREKS